MRRLMRKLLLGTVSVLALGIGGAALDAALNYVADAGNPENALSMPAASPTADRWGTDDSLRRNDIRWAQVQLRYRGLYGGSLDGILGPKTKRALAQFQHDNGLNRTASLDAPTWEALTSSTGITQGSSSMPPDPSGSTTSSDPASDSGR